MKQLNYIVIDKTRYENSHNHKSGIIPHRLMKQLDYVILTDETHFTFLKNRMIDNTGHPYPLSQLQSILDSYKLYENNTYEIEKLNSQL